MRRLMLVKYETKKVYDVFGCVGEITWSGEKSSAPRTLNFQFYSKYIDIVNGDYISFYEGEIELFRGKVFGVSRNKSRIKNIKCYDYMMSWKNNDDTFSLKGKTADQIFKMLCGKFQLPVGIVHNSGYAIPSLEVNQKDLYSVMLSAMSKTFKATGKRYFLRARTGYFDFIQRTKQIGSFLIEEGNNLGDFELNCSAEEVRNKIILVGGDNKNAIIAESSNSDSIKRYGLMTKIEKDTGKLNKAQLQSKANNLASTMSQQKSTLKVTNCLGPSNIITGDSVIIHTKTQGIQGMFYIDSDKHVFKGHKYHVITELSLNKEDTFQIGG